VNECLIDDVGEEEEREEKSREEMGPRRALCKDQLP
jgi:hypothetical protein